MIGKYINGYEIDEIINEGGMSIVYLGVHKKLRRKVAIKVLNPTLAKKPEILERFRYEAILLGQFTHTNIVAIYDYLESNEGAFIISEYVKGETLEDYIDLVTGPIPETKSVKLMLKMLDAVGHIHSKNIIHRDIKPSNFIITQDNDVKMIDFGIAKSLDYNSHIITKDGTKIGTTFYMSPQQVKGQILDRRTDIYSLGVTLFQMLTGQYPYEKTDSEFDIYNKIVNEPLPNAKELYVGVSDKMQDIITKATAKKPLDRFQSCEEFSYALLATQDKPMKTATLSLKTKLIEATDVDIKATIFSKQFWQNLILILTTVTFFSAIAVGIYLLGRKDIRHVLEDKENLLVGDSLNSEIIENLNYGETVKVLMTNQNPDKNGILWIKVYSLRGNAGFVPINKLAKAQIYRQINSLLGNSFARSNTSAFYKIALRSYFLDNSMIHDNTSDWKLFSEQKKDFEYNMIADGDFDGNSKTDFACVLRNTQTNENKLLIIFDNQKETISVNFSNSVKIKQIENTPEGGRWYIGNKIKRKNLKNIEYETQKLEQLPTDGILLLNETTKQTILYLYNKEEKMLNAFTQSE